MKTYAMYLRITLLFLSTSIGRTAEEVHASLAGLPRLGQEVQRLKETYRTEYIKRGSEDYQFFESIGKAAVNSPELIDSLIELCNVKEIPGTTEIFSPASLTPAASELKGLYPLSRPKVEAALLGTHLTLWQRAALEEVLYSLAVTEAGTKGLPPPREYRSIRLRWSDFDGVPAENAGSVLTSERLLLLGQPLFRPQLPSQITSPEPQADQPSSATPPQETQIKPQPGAPSRSQPISSSESKPTNAFPWGATAAVAAAVLAVSVAWIGIKKRK